MLNIVYIIIGIIGVILNVICIWSIKILLNDKDDLTWKSFLKYMSGIDRSTEIRLGDLEKKIDYVGWFCGHCHIDKQIDKIQMMCHDIRPLHMQRFGDE